MAEWSKALVLGTSLSGRGFESHRCQSDLLENICPRVYDVWRKRPQLEMTGIEPVASRMRIERSTTELHPQLM